MFPNTTKCIGKLCPKNLDKINVEGFISKVVLVPYIQTNDDGLYIGLLTDNKEFLWSDCEKNEKPFICAEETLQVTKIPLKNFKNITHIFLKGEKKPLIMLIFIRLDQKFKCLNFIKIYKNMEHFDEISYTLLKKKVTLKDLERQWPSFRNYSRRKR